MKNTKNVPSTCISGLVLTSMFRTRKGVQIMNPNKFNQDRFIVKENMQYELEEH